MLYFISRLQSRQFEIEKFIDDAPNRFGEPNIYYEKKSKTVTISPFDMAVSKCFSFCDPISHYSAWCSFQCTWVGCCNRFYIASLFRIKPPEHDQIIIIIIIEENLLMKSKRSTLYIRNNLPEIHINIFGERWWLKVHYCVFILYITENENRFGDTFDYTNFCDNITKCSSCPTWASSSSWTMYETHFAKRDKYVAHGLPRIVVHYI